MRDKDHIPVFPEETLLVKPWHDPLVEKLGYPLRSRYVERFWLPVLGPSATLLLRRLALGFEKCPDGYPVRTASLSVELGLGSKGGKNSPLWRSVERICRFKAAQRYGQILAVRVALPTIPPRQVRRLPGLLQQQHQDEVGQADDNEWREPPTEPPARGLAS